MNVYSVRLPQRTQGATASPIRARFLLPDGTVVDLTGATITATKKNINTDSLVTLVTGTLAPDVGQEADGWFNWDLSDDDVGEAGLFLVQFKATGGVAFDATSQGEWYLHPLQDAQAAAAPYLTGVTAAQKCALDNANAPSCANPFATVDDLTAFGIPLISPAVAGNLAVQTAGGELVDAGYAADVNATGGSVVRRIAGGTIVNTILTNSVGINGSSVGNVGVLAQSTNSTGALSSTSSGLYHHQFGLGAVSAIARTTGALTFLGASADANRLAQTNEVQAVSFGGAQTLTAPQQVQARANINAETAGAAATVAGNLSTHTGLTTTAHGGIVASTDPRLTDARTPTAHASTHATAGSDPITPAAIGAEVAGTTATHAGLTGTAVHGLGTISTQAANNVSITGGSVTGITDLAIADGGTGASTVDGARVNLGFAAVATPPRFVNHNFLTMAGVVVNGGTFSANRGDYLELIAINSANSSYRRYTTATILNLANASGWDWTRLYQFSAYTIPMTNNAEGVFRAFWGKTTADGFGVVANGNYIGYMVENLTITTGYVCRAGVLTTVPLTPTGLGFEVGRHVFVSSSNGTVSWFANGVTIGTTTAGPTATGVTGGISYEINNGATAAFYTVRVMPQSWGY